MFFTISLRQTLYRNVKTRYQTALQAMNAMIFTGARQDRAGWKKATRKYRIQLKAKGLKPKANTEYSFVLNTEGLKVNTATNETFILLLRSGLRT